MPTEGTTKRTIRIDDDLWERFGDTTPDRAGLLRTFIRWYVREPGVALPRRPRDAA